MFDISDTCLYCFGKPLFMASLLMGHFPFRWKCTHHRKQQKVEIRISWIFVAVSLFNSAFILVLGYYEFWNAFDTEKRIWEPDNMSAITLLSSSIGPGVTMMVMIERSRSTRSLLATLDVCLNLNYVCDKKEVIDRLYGVRRRSLLRLFIVLPGTVSVLCPIINEHTNIYLVPLRVYIMSIINMAWWLYADVLISLSELYFDSLRKVLKAKSECLEENAIKCHFNLNITDVLKQLTTTRLTNYHLIHSTNKYCSPVVAIFMILMLPFFYCSIYYAIIEFLKHGAHSSFMPMMWLWAIGAIQYVAQSYHQVIKMNDSFLSYLYRYPISRLSREERRQIETLIMVLKNQQHILRPSEMFTVSQRMPASILYIATTYVIVGVQFYFTNQ